MGLKKLPDGIVGVEAACGVEQCRAENVIFHFKSTSALIQRGLGKF
jgi:hypothetical protein